MTSNKTAPDADWKKIGDGYEWRVQLEPHTDEAVVTVRKGDRRWKRTVDTTIARSARMPAGAYYEMTADTLVDVAEVELRRNSVSTQ